MKMNHVSEKKLFTGLWMIVLLLTGVLCIWIRPASDDFYYVTFGDGGWTAFVNNNLEHYRTMSGRVFVHLILYPLLCLDMWPLRGFVAVLIGCFSVMAARLTAEEPEHKPMARLAALCIFWLIGIETLQDGALWGAGALNYLFPVSCVLAYALLLRRALEGRGGMWMGIPAFFCASTVEMTGILPCVVFVYLCLTNWERVREKWGTFLILGVCTLAGYLFLYTSAGVTERLENNSSGLSLMDTILINYAAIDRRVIGPEGIWLVTDLTLISGGLVLRQMKSGWGWGMLLLAGAVTLTGLGIVYDGVAVALIAICAFAALASFAVWSFRQGERQIPMWMLCVTISLGVCLVSPVMGSRLVMPTAVFLTVICVQNLVKLRFTRRQRLALTALLTAVACLVLLDHSVHFARNARVIDENARTVQSHREGTLVLELVPDERYSGPAVPTVSGFVVHYLKHHGLSGTPCAVQDPTESAISRAGDVLSQKALLRDGIWYVPIRVAEEAIGAEVRWELASGVVQIEEAIYCFHLGNRVANLGHGITGSVKLSGPVRNIGGRLYIPAADFSKLFGVELIVIANT